MSADEELGLVYLPVEMPTGDYYGGHRPGSGLFGESLVAVDLRTGKRKWHYQFIKHGIWDWDLPCAPILADVVIDGRLRKIARSPPSRGGSTCSTGRPASRSGPSDERARTKAL
jgi:quinoprotein glucose dehydrogenase